MQNPNLNLSLFLTIVWIILTAVNVLGLLSLIVVAIKKLFPKLKAKLFLYSVGELYLENKSTAIFFLSFFALSLLVSFFLWWSEDNVIYLCLSGFFTTIDSILYEKLKPKKQTSASGGFFGKFEQDFDSEPE